MDSAWRGATDTSAFWRKLIVVGSGFLGAVAVQHYLKSKREDLPTQQRKSLTIVGYTYAAQIALKIFYIQNTRPIPNHELFIFPVAFPTMMLIPAYFAKPFKEEKDEEKDKVKRRINISNILYGFV